jgi:hypothetical protein
MAMATASRAVVNSLPCCGQIAPDHQVPGAQKLLPFLGLTKRSRLEDARSASLVGGSSGWSGNGGTRPVLRKISAVASTEAAPQAKVSSSGGKYSFFQTLTSRLLHQTVPLTYHPVDSICADPEQSSRLSFGP